MRKYYCLRCRNRAPRSTGVRLCEVYLEKLQVIRLLDYGCSTWRNTRYICEKFGKKVKLAVRCDITPITRPDVVCYPTMLPFRDRVFNVVLFSHILMFLRSKEEWDQALAEIKRVSCRFVVVECYQCKGVPGMAEDEKPLQYTLQELMAKLTRFFKIRSRVVNKMLHCFLLTVPTSTVLL